MSCELKSGEFISAAEARLRSDRAKALYRKRTFTTEWLRVKEEIETAISEGRTSIMTSQRLSISPEIVETLIEWGYSVESTKCGQQTISW